MSYADKINQAKSQTIKANDVRLMVDKDIDFLNYALFVVLRPRITSNNLLKAQISQIEIIEKTLY